jgi:hypothetical protein
VFLGNTLTPAVLCQQDIHAGRYSFLDENTHVVKNLAGVGYD